MKQARQRQIRQLIQQKKNVSIGELCETFHISVETVRRDLTQLEKEGGIKRVYGGAIIPDDNDHQNRMIPWDVRYSTNQNEKEALALAALDMIPDNATIALDSGTTMLALAKHLGTKKNLTVITNDFHIAMELLTNTSHKLVFIGGSMDREGLISTGYLAIDFLGSFSNIDLCIASADGFNTVTGLSDNNIDMGTLKGAIISKSTKVIVVFDHSKFTVNCLYNVCPITSLHTIITDGAAPKKAVDKLRQAGLDVVLVNS